MFQLQRNFPAHLPTQSKVFKLGRSIAFSKDLNDQGNEVSRKVHC